jgi:hypothetical protein
MLASIASFAFSGGESFVFGITNSARMFGELCHALNERCAWPPSSQR